MHALAVWLVTGAICAVMIYVSILPFVRRLGRSIGTKSPATAV
jgi:hypothetical protein